MQPQRLGAAKPTTAIISGGIQPGMQTGFDLPVIAIGL